MLQLAFLSSNVSVVYMDFELPNHTDLELWFLCCIYIYEDLGSLPKKITKTSENDTFIPDYARIVGLFLLLKSEKGIFRVEIAPVLFIDVMQ